MSGFSNERTWSRGASSVTTEDTTPQKDPQFDPFAGISMYTRPVIAGVASVGMGAMALRSKNPATRIALAGGSALAAAISKRAMPDTTH